MTSALTHEPLSGLELRPATPEDLPFLREMCYEAAFASERGGPEDPPPPEEALRMPWMQDYTEGWGRDGDYGLIAVNEAGDNVGAAWYRRYSEGRHVRPHELSMAVREEDRGKSVGQTLLTALLERAGEEGIDRIGLQVAANNEAAQGLYRKLGFTMVGGQDEYENRVMVAATRPDAETSGPEADSGLVLPEGYTPRDYYDEFAPLHDRYARAADMPAKVDRMTGQAVALKRGGPIRSALDLGVGTGFSVEAILNHASPERLVGVDISPGMLDQLRQKHGPSVVETVESSVEDYVSGCEETFDLVESMGTLEFMEDLPAVLRGIPRLLNRGGLFVATYLPMVKGGEKVITNDSPYLRQKLVRYSSDPEKVEEALVAGGLEIVHRDSSLPAYPVHDKWVHYNFVVAAKPAA